MRKRVVITTVVVAGFLGLAAFAAHSINKQRDWRDGTNQVIQKRDKTRIQQTWLERAEKSKTAGNLDKAREHTERAAELGHLPSIRWLASNYENGTSGFDTSDEKADYWFEKSGKEIYALYLGRSASKLADNALNEKDYKVAVAKMRKSADLGNELAQLSLAKFYEEGMGVEQDYSKADSIVIAMLDTAKNDRTKFEAAKYIFFRSLDDGSEKGLKVLEGLSANGHHDASELLGELYFKGEKLDQSYEKAASYFSDVESLNLKNTVNYATLLRTGVGTEQNQSKAFNMFRRLADNGVQSGHVNLGHMYRYGWGTEKNQRLAEKHYKSDGYGPKGEAALYLGCLYQSGELGSPNIEEAIKAYSKANDEDTLGSYYAMGLLYETGIGVDRDPVKAFNFVKDDAHYGYPLAQKKVAEYYSAGFGVKVSTQTAAIWADKYQPNSFLVRCLPSDSD